MNEFRWPLTLQHGDVRLRPLRRSDETSWVQTRERNADWLHEWEATTPIIGGARAPFATYVRRQRRDARDSRGLPMVIEHQGRFVGQLTLGNVVWGSFRSGYIGYWIDRAVAGRGIMQTAVAMLTDYALLEARLHRIEVNIRPENAASIRVVEKLGFRSEGLRPRYLHINGGWRDHLSFAMLAEELPAGGLAATRPTQH